MIPHDLGTRLGREDLPVGCFYYALGLVMAAGAVGVTLGVLPDLRSGGLPRSEYIASWVALVFFYVTTPLFLFGGWFMPKIGWWVSDSFVTVMVGSWVRRRFAWSEITRIKIRHKQGSTLIDYGILVTLYNAERKRMMTLVPETDPHLYEPLVAQVERMLDRSPDLADDLSHRQLALFRAGDFRPAG